MRQMSTLYNLFYFSVTMPKELELGVTCVKETPLWSSQAHTYPYPHTKHILLFQHLVVLIFS